MQVSALQISTIKALHQQNCFKTQVHYMEILTCEELYCANLLKNPISFQTDLMRIQIKNSSIDLNHLLKLLEKVASQELVLLKDSNTQLENQLQTINNHLKDDIEEKADQDPTSKVGKIHNFYQNLFVSQLKEEVNKTTQEFNELLRQRKESTLSNHLYLCDQSQTQLISDQSQQNLNMHREHSNKYQHTSATHFINENVFMTSFLHLDKAVQKLNSIDSLDQFFMNLEDALIDIFHQAMVRIMMVDKDIQNLYKQEKDEQFKNENQTKDNLTTSYFLDDVRFEIISSIKNQQKYPKQKIKIPQVVDLEKGLFQKHIFAFPVKANINQTQKQGFDKSKNLPLIYIYIENKNIAFTTNDEVIANHFQVFLSAIFEKLFFFKMYQYTRFQNIQMLNLCNNISQQKTHLKLQRSLRENLPSIFDFKQVNILFRDPFKLQNNSLCYLKEDTALNDQFQRNQKYSDQVVRVPSDVGITGRAIKDKKCLLSVKGSYDNRFRFESDNPMDLTYIQNILIVPLFMNINGQEELMGVIQFFNKINQDLIHEIDYGLIEAVASIVGAVIETADELHSSWMIIYELREQVTKLMTSIQKGLFEVESQAKVYKEANQCLFDANIAIKQLVKSKKNQFIAELVSLKNCEFISKNSLNEKMEDGMRVRLKNKRSSMRQSDNY
ncbi:UNKNOWN [Stylonychia lemnae]|uniref:GAF domain-containing protein n=1 Tax=Stylonychia lemnae TaxID=5949 RepID=A0A078B8Z9_STYLE|nr:UNKNOWN [Stylonychia lemnae]|eukprot:CDW90975.1 UNKNOWN [Stylonychia lemnae]